MGAVMDAFEEHLAREVDEVLDPVWSRERRRGIRRLAYTTLGRIAVGLLTMWVVAIVAHLVVPESFPWGYFAVITVLGTTIAALVNLDSTAHLKRD